MRTGTTTLGRYGGWLITACTDVTPYDTEAALRILLDAGIDYHNASRAYRNISQGHKDTGLCFSNPKTRTSIIIISKTSSPRQALNSISHEIAHCCQHISNTLHIDPYSEDLAYLAGDIAMALYPKIRHLICDCHTHTYPYNTTNTTHKP